MKICTGCYGEGFIPWEGVKDGAERFADELAFQLYLLKNKGRECKSKLILDSEYERVYSQGMMCDECNGGGLI